MRIGPCAVAADEAARPGWAARLDLSFARRGERSALVGCAHHGPLRVQKALHPEGPGVCQVIVLHPPGGVAGGDSLEISVSAATGSHALLTTPGAGKWYRAGGRPARQALTVRVDRQATVEWLPQETIVFDGCEASIDTRVELAEGALYCGWEILCLGRTAAGERFTRGHLDLATRIERAGAPLWVERGQIAGGSPWLMAAPGLAGQPVCATLLLAGPAVDGEWIDACRAIPPGNGVLGGVSALPEVLVARCLAPAAQAARGWFTRLWQQLRPRVVGRVADPPRIWNT